jgi:hypothetical protein
VKYAIGIFFIAAVGFAAPAETKKGLYLIVTPKGIAKFHCKVESTQIPEVQEMGQTPLKVTVYGGENPYSWRLPLYQINNGANDIAAAQLGKANAGPDHSFIITVPTYEMGRANTEQPMNLEVKSKTGEATTCQTASAMPVAARAKVTAPVQGAVAP